MVATGRLRVRIKASEPGRIRASARRGKRRIAKSRAPVGGLLRKTVRLKLSRSPRRRLRGLERGRITVRVVSLSSSTLPPDGGTTKTFNVGGIGPSIATDMVLNMTDAREVIGGYASSLDPHFAMVRYNVDGSLDRELGGSGGGALDGTGGVLTPHFATSEKLHALAIQPHDGFIVVGGRAVRSTGKFMQLPYWEHRCLLAQTSRFHVS